MPYKRIVIKIGSSSLTHASGMINLEQIENIAWVLSDLRAAGYEVVLVSSGAIAVGKERLRLKERPRDVTMRQVASAVGQGALMQIYEASFNKLGQQVAQILLTKDVLTHPQMRQNAFNAMSKLLELNVIAIVNENDTVSTDELQGFSDNDNLAACVAELIEADLLVLLSDIDAMYDKNPNIHKDAKAIRLINEITPQLAACIEDISGGLGTGGMSSKIAAAAKLMPLKIDCVIASAKDMRVLRNILKGDEIGTKFIGAKNA